MDNRGLAIAEGDILVLCIRLFSELLLGRYTLPQPRDGDALLARHAAAIFARGRALLASFERGHRDEAFNNLVLPQSELAITALGHALAYDAARAAGVPAPLLELFECYVVQLDPTWYSEHAGISGDAFRRKEDAAAQAALPQLKEYVDQMDVRRWVTAPILSDAAWSRWHAALPIHSGFNRQFSVPVKGKIETVASSSEVESGSVFL